LRDRKNPVPHFLKLEEILRAVIQRVTHGKVSVDNRIVAEINLGLVILLGIGHGDDESKVSYLADKIATLRIFEDAQGKMNRSLLDVQGEALVVSQFTLYADTNKGRRPSFIDAALPDIARPLVDSFAKQLIDLGVPTQQGEFGAHMLVEIENDGPVTIILER
jgi:D-tyrosyl-tRNA(Tyr) deacylase